MLPFIAVQPTLGSRGLLLPYAPRPPVVAHRPLKCWVIYLQYFVEYPNRLLGPVRWGPHPQRTCLWKGRCRREFFILSCFDI